MIFYREDKSVLDDRMANFPSPDDSVNLLTCKLTLKDIHLVQINIPKGTTIDKDVNCNSKFIQN